MKQSGKHRKMFALLIAFTLSLTAAFAVPASAEEEGYPIRAFFEEMGFFVTWQSEDQTFHLKADNDIIVFHTLEPLLYINDEAIPLQDGITMRDAEGYITINDLLLFQNAMTTAVITEGESFILLRIARYGKGTTEQNEMVKWLLGEENTQEAFELYFHWYNVLHELGHSIVAAHSQARPTPWDEEQLVNDFAVAYWRYYGEEEKLSQLAPLVAYTLKCFDRPVDENTTHMEYYQEAIKTASGYELLFSMNNYGWFQYSCVSESLFNQKSLESVLAEMGVQTIAVQPQKALVYPSLGDDAVSNILGDAISIMRDWGVVLSDAYIEFTDDPSANSSSSIGIESAEELAAAGEIVLAIPSANQ